LDVYIKSQGGADLEISSGAETGADIGSELTLRSQSRSHQYTQATYGNSEPITIDWISIAKFFLH